MNIGRMIFAFTREQYLIAIECETAFVYPPCPKCMTDYALVDFDNSFDGGPYVCKACGGSIRVEIKEWS